MGDAAGVLLQFRPRVRVRCNIKLYIHMCDTCVGGACIYRYSLWNCLVSNARPVITFLWLDTLAHCDTVHVMFCLLLPPRPELRELVNFKHAQLLCVFHATTIKVHMFAPAVAVIQQNFQKYKRDKKSHL